MSLLSHPLWQLAYTVEARLSGIYDCVALNVPSFILATKSSIFGSWKTTNPLARSNIYEILGEN